MSVVKETSGALLDRPPAVHVDGIPQFLVVWSSPWREFVESLGPALRPSPPCLHLETQAGLFPARGLLWALFLEAAVLVTSMILPHDFLQSQAERQSASLQAHDVIYFSADELPRTRDLAGGSAGRHGAAGGTSLLHPSQTIKVARGENLRARVIDAPNLKLPESRSEISNLLAYKAELPAQPPAPKPPALPAILVRGGRKPEIKRDNREIKAPKVSFPKSAMPDLPQASVTAQAPPPVAAPIRVTRNQPRLALPEAAAPAVSSSGQMPNLPETNIAVNAPATPIKVARNRSRTSREDSSQAAPRLDTQSRDASRQLSSLMSSPATMPTGPSRPAAGSQTVAVIVTPNPGSKPAAPREEEKTTVAMARNGSKEIGSGGAGGGTGMQPGKGPGSSESGSNHGATSVGNDKGTDFYARDGNSPNLGPGGTGNLSSGTPSAPGVSVSGGKTSITLPSFGATPSPASAGRSETAKNMGNGITVIASPRAGGALNLYGALKGDRVYTIYINTRIGTAVMQFSDPASAGHAYPTELTAPRVLQAEVPSELLSRTPHSRLLIRCDLDSNGVVKNARIVQSDGGDFGAKILAALPTWKFTAAIRGNKPVAVEAILGFGVDTN